jgi:adenine-specific DNA-methyltransferase
MGNTAKPTVLDHSLKLFIPTQCRCGKELPADAREAVFEEAKQKMRSWFDGATLGVDRLSGLWGSESGDVAEEVVDVIHSYSDKDSFINNKEDFMAYAAELANLLTQDAVACELDGKLLIFPSTQNIKPHRCANGSASDQLPNPVDANELQKRKSLQAALLRLESVRDVRDLFCRKLHYDFVDDDDGQLPAHAWPESVTECLAPGSAPQIVADKNGFKIIYIKLAKDSLRKSFERKIVQRIIKDDPSLRGLIVVSDIEAKQWELVNVKVGPESEKKSSFLFRRMRIGPGQESRTAVERLAMVDTELFADDVTAAEIQDKQDEAFDVESVSKEFFNEISNWYFWALSQVEFPTDTENNDEKHRATSLIRFLTRIIFCWFLKEKGLIPGSLFREKDLADILVDLDPDSCTYHQGILQNLFFATLNQRMGKDSKGKPYRAFVRSEGFQGNKSTYSIDTLYRYEEHFQDSDKAIGHFADIPFLNGGLFECLDRTDENTGKKLYVDGFSRNMKKRARVPNRLFFAGEQTVDLSEVYGDTGRRNAKVRGLVRILHAYNFTVEENTPIDEEIALDPELLGKVFENLLASYNEETKTTARKQTGSFYTPRPIVEYMVDESLKAHLTGSLVKLGRKEEEAREQLDLLLGYTDEEPSFSEEETSALLEAIHTCKILDPACGSGAFPIGMLQKLVHIVHKLDPENARWKQLQVDQAAKIPDTSARDAAIKAIERDFEENGDGYGRKLYLIENCLYGVDIQPIAIQISKLRFFISLICDQKTNRDKAQNHGIRALPNLETKFVAADTLFGLPEMDQMDLVDPRVNQIESEIESLYHRHFTVRYREQKRKIQDNLKELRKELVQVLAESLGSSQKAQHLAEWDPFDSQSSSDFFDPHWMFGRTLERGFNIIIQNPPYISHDKLSEKVKRTVKRYDSWEPFADLYCYFLEQSNRLLQEGGISCAITSNSFLRADYGGPLKVYINKSARIKFLLSLDRAQVFENAIVNVVITLFVKGKQNGEHLNYVAGRGEWKTKVFGDYVRDQTFECKLVNLQRRVWSLSRDSELAIISSLEPRNPTLSQRNTKIRLGLATGSNKAFLIESSQYSNLIARDKNTTQIMKPVIRGRDIDRYKIDPPEQYLILSKNGVNLPKDYPILAAHLEQFGTKFRQRGAQGKNWWNLRACSFYSDFEKNRIVWIELTNDPRFAVCPAGIYMLNTAYFLLPPENLDAYALTAILNSSVSAFYMRHTAQTSGMGVTRWFKEHVSEIPVPNLAAESQSLLSALGRLRHYANSGAIDFTEALIDACVMECYFREHMAERNLLFLEDLGVHLDSYNPDASEAKQREFLDQFHSTLNADGSRIRDRLNRICKDSPHLLAVIKEEGKV